jgi:hypothetical protein
MSVEVIRFEGLAAIALKAPALFLPKPKASQRFLGILHCEHSQRENPHKLGHQRRDQ